MSILLVSFYLGAIHTKILLLVLSLLLLDEVHVNFFKRIRTEWPYLISHLVILVPFVYLNFIDRTFDLQSIVFNTGILFNFVFIYFLFITPMEGKLINYVAKHFPFLGGVVVFVWIQSLAYLFVYSNWRILVGLILVIAYVMDTGAWFFGKNFGKHKLWPEVSPNKTIEGLIGGALSSGLVASLYWIFLVTNKDINFSYGTKIVLIFIGLAILSQIGDLAQSKLKRIVNIKDSSSLIPGHGGVYDRVDSLLFIAPFFAQFLHYSLGR
jgi:phosphatidate cytidylyltransferase